MQSMEKEAFLPRSVTRALVAAVILLISLSILSIGDYRTGTGPSDTSRAFSQTQTEMQTENRSEEAPGTEAFLTRSTGGTV